LKQTGDNAAVAQAFISAEADKSYVFAGFVEPVNFVQRGSGLWCSH